MTVCIPSQPVSLSAACLLHKSRDQYFPRLHRVTRGAHTLGTSMLCLLGCGSRGCISLMGLCRFGIEKQKFCGLSQLYREDWPLYVGVSLYVCMWSEGGRAYYILVQWTPAAVAARLSLFTRAAAAVPDDKQVRALPQPVTVRPHSQHRKQHWSVAAGADTQPKLSL